MTGRVSSGAPRSGPAEGREPEPTRDAACAAARAWLELRSHTPDALRAPLGDALGRVGAVPEPLPAPGGVPAALAAAAISLLEEEGRGPGPGRKRARASGTDGLGEVNRRARDLLAADALLTHACEAAAEVGPEAVLALERSFGPGRLSLLLPDPVAS